MKRAQLNYLVDAVITAAFLVCAVTGILFLLPATWIAGLGLGRPGMLGISFAAWRWLHDWSGVAASVGVVVHFALHWRWVVTMTRRTLLAPSDEQSRSPRASREASLPDSPRPYSVYQAGAVPAPGEPARRYSRRGLLAGGAVAGGALIVGAGLLDRLVNSGGSGLGFTSASQRVASGAQAAGAAGSTAASSAQGDTANAGDGSASTNATTQVSVDSGACVGCGRCLSVCPAGVFAWGGSGRATARSPDQCVRCYRCLQACPASAITVSA